MSLLKQLLLSVTVAIAAILVGVMVFSVDAARSYLVGQLQAQSDNAASSMALQLSQPGNQDPASRELLLSALYDSGQFRRIVLVDPAGRLLFERSNLSSSGGRAAPVWFSDWLPLAEPASVREVSDGWRQVGRLTVSADDGYARDALWYSSLRMLVLVVAAGLAWALFVVLLVRWLKRALRDEISAQVRAIAEDTSATPASSAGAGAPRVKELASVVNAIRETRARVRATAQEQIARIESLQLEVNLDPVTQLANRKYIVNELRRELAPADGDEASTGGHVLIFRQRDLTAINAVMTRAGVDEWLQLVADGLAQVLAGQNDPSLQLARLNGSDFVLLMPGYDGPRATRLAQSIRQRLLAARVQVQAGHLCRWAFAMTDYLPGCEVAEVLGRLDHGLMCAESAGHGDVEYVPREGTWASAGVSESAWRSLLGKGLERGWLALDVVRADYGDSALDRHDASLVMHDEDKGDTLSGYVFMPAAVRLGLSAECDLRALELALQWLENHSGELVVKVSLPSLEHPRFLPEVQQLLLGLQASPELISRLIVELDAHGLVAQPDEVQAFVRFIAEAGARVGLRRLAQQPAALLSLHEVPFDYVKLGGEFVERLHTSPGAMQLLIAIVETASVVGLQVYADGVPDAESLQILREHGVSTLGYEG